MKRKELGRYDWKNILERQDFHCCWQKNFQRGEAALIHIIKAAKTGIGQFRGEPVVVLVLAGFALMMFTPERPKLSPYFYSLGLILAGMGGAIWNWRKEPDFTYGFLASALGVVWGILTAILFAVVL